MSGPVDVRGILERAGADADAPEGSQAWALAQVDAAVTELVTAVTDETNALRAYRAGSIDFCKLTESRVIAAISNITGATK